MLQTAWAPPVSRDAPLRGHATPISGPPAHEAARAALITALAAGTEPRAAPPLDVTAAEALAAELRTAKAALAQAEGHRCMCGRRR